MVLGLDLASVKTGVAILDDNGKVVEHVLVKGRGKEPVERTLKMCSTIMECISKYKIDIAVVEDVLLNKSLPNLNTCRVLVRMQGMMLGMLHSNGIPIILYAPNRWKSLIGIYNGEGGKTRDVQKERMMKLVFEKFGIEVEDNQADAIGLALAYFSEKESQT